jgi:hypothetical protein
MNVHSHIVLCYGRSRAASSGEMWQPSPRRLVQASNVTAAPIDGRDNMRWADLTRGAE